MQNDDNQDPDTLGTADDEAGNEMNASGEDVIAEEQPLLDKGPGTRLREAREAKGLDLDQVTAKTRIPLHQLESIEAGDFAALPSRTYALGFSRTYARHLGLDEREIGDAVRAELADSEAGAAMRANNFEPGDPARVPSRGLMWFSIFAIVLLVAGGFAFYRTYLAPGSGPGSLVAQQQAEDAAERAAASSDALRDARGGDEVVDPDGAVVFTALEEGIWVKFYDGSGSQLMQKQMAKGETYTVPAEAAGPQVWTGRPDALSITIGGRSVPKLAQEDQIMKDIPVTAEALLARDAPEPELEAEPVAADAQPAAG
ncbi:hypothetical protein HME9302_00388 [Alteripontixanthobacter maritimus]|uniref:Cytoskeleton protein RodZ-like C-terminal domain-containing protein n=1 Tax=Alteripontixanthobacter maritimus TaxID=2161824 RepID=A0A369Q2S7_9SPHN|nr:helix-turn-helix domain-containing protein [Alteripontixanthobacter maritimus]RDC59203.1 hypothetical protein HME9302_00388 [Alteripontixanthobacter maritimus]